MGARVVGVGEGAGDAFAAVEPDRDGAAAEVDCRRLAASIAGAGATISITAVDRFPKS